MHGLPRSFFTAPDISSNVGTTKQLRNGKNNFIRLRNNKTQHIRYFIHLSNLKWVSWIYGHMESDFYYSKIELWSSVSNGNTGGLCVLQHRISGRQYKLLPVKYVQWAVRDWDTPKSRLIYSAHMSMVYILRSKLYWNSDWDGTVVRLVTFCTWF